MILDVVNGLGLFVSHLLGVLLHDWIVFVHDFRVRQQIVVFRKLFAAILAMVVFLFVVRRPHVTFQMRIGQETVFAHRAFEITHARVYFPVHIEGTVVNKLFSTRLALITTLTYNVSNLINNCQNSQSSVTQCYLYV